MSAVLALLAVLWTPQVCEPPPHTPAMACWPGICCELASASQGSQAEGYLCEGASGAASCNGSYASCGEACGENDCFSAQLSGSVRYCCTGGANA